jgi:hypothetical protein
MILPPPTFTSLTKLCRQARDQAGAAISAGRFDVEDHPGRRKETNCLSMTTRTKEIVREGRRPALG